MSALNPYAPPNPLPEDDPPLVAQLAVEGEGMTVEYEQSFEDLVSFSEFFHKRVATSGRYLFAVLGAILIALGVLTMPHGLAPADFHLAPTVFVCAGLALVILWAYTFFGRRQLIRRNLQRLYAGGKNLNVVGLRRITIMPDFIIYASPLCQSAHRWVGIEKVESDQEAIYIFNTPLTAYVLPRRAFVSDQHFHDFATQAGKYLSANAAR